MTHLTALNVCLTASLLTGSANPIEYKVHSGYFEKNNSGLKDESGVMRGKQPAKEVDTDVSGLKTLILQVGDAGDGIDHDHADWARRDHHL